MYNIIIRSFNRTEVSVDYKIYRLCIEIPDPEQVKMRAVFDGMFDLYSQELPKIGETINPKLIFEEFFKDRLWPGEFLVTGVENTPCTKLSDLDALAGKQTVVTVVSTSRSPDETGALFISELEKYIHRDNGSGDLWEYSGHNHDV